MAAFFLYWLLSKAPYSLRLIDLISFFFGALALLGGLFSSYHYRGEMLQSMDQLWARSTVVDIAFDAGVSTMLLCERVPHTPFRPPASKKAECDKLDQYLKGLRFDPLIPTPLRLPNVTDYNDPDVRKIAEHVFERVNEANRQIGEYERGRLTHWKITTLEALFRDAALPVLAFAFGLGVARRTIDLYLTLPPWLQRPTKLLLRAMRRMSRRGRRRLILLASPPTSPFAFSIKGKPPRLIDGHGR